MKLYRDSKLGLYLFDYTGPLGGYEQSTITPAALEYLRPDLKLKPGEGPVAVKPFTYPPIILGEFAEGCHNTSAYHELSVQRDALLAAAKYTAERIHDLQATELRAAITMCDEGDEP